MPLKRLGSFLLRPPFILGVVAVLLVSLVAGASHALAAATVAPLVSYQARLMDPSGFPVSDGAYSVQFSLYDAPTGGNRLWTASGSTSTPAAISVSVANGLFSVLLGDTGQNTLDSVDWNQDALYIGVTIGADAEMTPRRRLASAPQAFNARQLQGMFASSTAFGANSLFTINQTSNTAATGTRTALEVRSAGTSNSNDFLFRGVNDLASTVFSVNRQGSVTGTGVLAITGSGTSTFAGAVSSTYGEFSVGLSVGGTAVCLASGANCQAGTSGSSTSTLAEVSARGSFATTTLQLYGGFVGSSSTVTSTLTVLGGTSLQSVTATNVTTSWLGATTVSTTNLFVNGSQVCLQSGTNCPSSIESDTLALVASRGNFATSTLLLYGGFVGSSSTVTSTFTVLGGMNFQNATGANVTTSNLFVSGAVSTTQLFVNGQLACLANGTNCQGGSGTSTNFWVYNLTDDFLRVATNTTDVVIGGQATSTSAAAYFDNSGGTRGTSTVYFGFATNTNVVIGGTSTTQTGLSPFFTMNGDDLFVRGNIGSAANVFANSAFVAGDTTVYADGAITQLSGALSIAANEGITANNRFSALYLNRWFLSPLLNDTVYGSASATVVVGNNPTGVAFDGSHIWVANSNSNSVSKIDPTSNSVIATVPVGTSPQGVAFDGTSIWAVNNTSGNVSKININTNSVIATTTVGTTPVGIVSTDGFVWVSNIGSGTVSKINVNTNTIAATVAVGTGPRSLAFDGQFVWVANAASDNVSKISIDTNTVVATTTVGDGPFGVAFDGSHIWVSNSISNNISKIDSRTDAVVATTTAVGGGPSYVAFDGDRVWVGNTVSSTVVKIDIKTNAVVATYPTISGPNGIAFDGSHMWIANTTANQVMKLPIGGGNGSQMALHVNLAPDINNTFDIGSGSFSFRDIYASGTAHIATDVLVGGVSVCLENGINCPVSGGGSDSNWSYLSAFGSIRLVTTSNDVIIGSSATSTGAPAYFDNAGETTGTSTVYLGHATNTNVIIGGTSSSVDFLNPAYSLNGNDLFVGGNIGSASSVYTNGAFIAGSGSTYYQDGLISKRDAGTFRIRAFNGTLALETNTGVIGIDPVIGGVGDVVIGGDADDRITLQGLIDGGLRPNGSNAVDIGEDGLAFRNIFASGTSQLAFVSTTLLTVGGQRVCLADGSDCPEDVYLQITDTLTGLQNPDDVFAVGRYAYVVNQSDRTLSVVDAFDENNVSVVGSVEVSFGSSPSSVFVDGNYAYVTVQSSSNTLSIIDISSSTNPVFVARQGVGNTPTDVYVKNGYAYVVNSNSASLSIINVTNPLAPVSVATTTVGTTPSSVYVSGNYAYVTSFGAEQLDVVDVTNPASPSVVETVTGLAQPQSLAVVNGFAYVANTQFGNNTVSIIDVNDPTNAFIVTSTFAGFGANDLSVSGHFLYVVNANSGSRDIAVIDIDDPYRPKLVSYSQVGPSPLRISIAGRLAFITSGFFNNQMTVARLVGDDVTDFYAVRGDIDSLSVTQNLTVAGQFVCLANGTNCPAGGGGSGTTPTLAIVTAQGNFATSTLRLFGGFLAASSTVTSTLTVLGQTTLGNVTSVNATSVNLFANTGRFATATIEGVGICLSNGAYCPSTSAIEVDTLSTVTMRGAFSTNTLQLYNGFVGSSSTVTSTFTVLGGTNLLAATATNVTTTNLFVSGTASTSQLYVAGQLVCLASGANCPATAAGTETLGTVSARGDSATTTLQLFGGFVGASSTVTSTLTVLGDASLQELGFRSASASALSLYNPSRPVELSALDIPGTNDFDEIAVSDKYVYAVHCCSPNSFSVYDISAGSATPTYLATEVLGGNPSDLVVRGRYAYVSIAASALVLTIDISTSTDPRVIATSTMPGVGNLTDFVVEGRYLYTVGSSANRLSIFDLANPLSPTLISNTSLDAVPDTIVVRNGFAYIGYNTNTGMRIVDVTDPYAPVLAGRVIYSGDTADIKVSGRYAYVAKFTGLNIIDVASSSAPVVLATSTYSASETSVAIAGTYAFVSDDADIIVIDVSSSTNPVQRTVSSIGAGGINDMLIAGRYLYAASDELSIVDIGGLDAFAARIGAFEAETGIISNRLSVGGSVDVRDGLIVGQAGIYTPGGISAAGTSTFNYVSTTSLTVNGSNVCLQTGVNCPTADLNWTFVAASSTIRLATTSNDIVLGGVATTTNLGGAPAYFDLAGQTSGSSSFYFGFNTSSNVLIGATSNSTPFMNALFAVNGSDLFVGGNIGSASSIYTNGAFVAGSGSTYYQDGLINKTNGDMVVAASTNVLRGLTHGLLSLGNVTTSLANIYSSGTIFYTSASGTNLFATYLEATTSSLRYASSTYLSVTNLEPRRLSIVSTSDTQVTGLEFNGRFLYSIGSDQLSVIDVTEPDQPRVMGTIGFNSAGSDLQVSGGYAYVSRNGNDQYNIIDISQPTLPTPFATSSLSGFNAGYFEGNYAYLNIGTNLSVYENSNPGSPILLDTIALPTGFSTANGVKMEGGIVYVVAQSTGRIAMYDVRNPNDIILLGTHTFGNNVGRRFDVNGRYVYVGSGNAGNSLNVLDTLNPSNIYVASTSTPSGAGSSGNYGAKAIDNTAYFFRDSSLFIIDVTSSTSATIMKTYTASSNINDVEIQGRTVFLGLSNGNIEIVDMGGLEAQHAMIGSLKVDEIRIGDQLRVSGLADFSGSVNVGLGGLQSYGSLSILGSTTSVFNGAVSTTNLLTNGITTTNLYVTGTISGNFLNFNTFDRANLLTNYNPGVTALQDIDIVGKYAYVTENATLDALLVFDINDPSNPILVSSSTLGVAGSTSPENIIVDGKYVYIAGQSSTAALEIYELVDNGARARRVGLFTHANGGSGAGLAVAGKYAYITSGSNIMSIDVSTPSSTRLASTATLSGSTSREIFVSGNRAYVGKDTTLMSIVDITNPEAMTQLSSVTSTNITGRTVYVSGNMAYIIGIQASVAYLHIYNVASSTNPIFMGRTAVDSNTGRYSVQVMGGVAYIGTPTNGLALVDVTSSTNPHVIREVDDTTSDGLAKVVGRYAYIATPAGGLNVIDLYGAHIGNLDVGTVQTSQASITDNLFVGQAATVQGYLSVGAGMRLDGGLTISATNTTSTFNGVVTTTRAYFNDFISVISPNSTSSFIGAVSSTYAEFSRGITVGGVGVCLTSGAGCPPGSSGNDTLATVTNRAAIATSTLTLYGGFIGGSSTVTSTFRVLGQGILSALTVTGSTALANTTLTNATATNVTTTNLFASGTVSTSQLFVGGRLVCLASGTNCPASGGSGTTTNWWVYNPTGDFIRTTTGNTNLVVGGTSTTVGFMNPLFTLDGNDLFVGGNIGSASSIYTNGAFVAGAGSTHFGNGYIRDTSGPLVISAASGTIIDSGLSFAYNGRSRMTTSSEVTVHDNPRVLKTQGHYAYLVNNAGPKSLRILDISNPAAPSTTADLYLDGNCEWEGLDVSGKYAYTVNYCSSLFQIIDVSDPHHPFITSTTTVSQAGDIRVSGRYAYITEYGASMLRVYDISNPSNPVKIDEIASSNAWYLDIHGNYLTVMAYGGGTVRLYDITDPTALRLTAEYTVVTGLGSYPRLEMDDSYVYIIAQNGSNLLILDYSDPANPRPAFEGALTSGPATISSLQDLSLNGRYLYLTDSGLTSYVHVVDILNRNAPLHVASFNTGQGSIQGIDISGKYAYILHPSEDLMAVVNLGGLEATSLLAHSAEIGTLSVVGRANFENVLTAQGGMFVGPSGLNSIGALSVSATNTTSTFAGAVSTARLQVNGQNVCLANGTNCPASGAASFEMTYSSTSVMSIEGTISTIDSPRFVRIKGDYAYVIPSSATPRQLQIVDISNPSAPSTTAQMWLPGSSTWNDMDVSGNFLYHVDYGEGLFNIIDISAPEAPSIVSTSTLSTGTIGGIRVSGNYAFISYYASGELVVMDISNPKQPVQIAIVGGASNIWHMDIQGNYLYSFVWSGNTFYVHNISDPRNPRLIATKSLGGSYGQYSRVEVEGSYAYIFSSSGDNLAIVDIGDPTNPKEVYAGTISGATSMQDISINGRYLYGLENANPPVLHVIDVLDRANPTLVYSYSLTGLTSGFGIDVSGRHAVALDPSGDQLAVVELGGMEATSLLAHSAEVGQLNVTGRTTIQNTLSVLSGVSIGAGGLQSFGSLSVYASNTTSSFAGTVSTSRLTVGGQRVCLQSGTNCPSSSGTSTNSWVFNSQGGFIRVTTPTTDIVLGSTVTSTGAPAYFDLAGGTSGSSSFYFGFNTSSNVVIGGTSNTVSFMNSEFRLNGNDLFVGGSIGSASSIYTNGGFVASTPNQGRTYYGDGVIHSSSLSLLLFAEGGMTLTGNGGNINLGGVGAGDAIFFYGDVFSDITPAVNNTHSLGNLGRAFSSLHAVNVSATTVTTTNLSARNLSLLIDSNRTITAVSSVTVGANPQKVVARNRSAYVINDGPSDFLQIIDASNPASPTTTATGGLPDGASQIELAGDYAYVVATTSQNLVVKNLKIPQVMSFGGQTLAVSSTRDVKARGRYVFVGTSAAGRDVVVLENLGGSVKEIGARDFGGTYLGNMDIDGRYLYYCSGISTCHVIDTSDPADLVEPSGYIPHSYADFVANNGYLYALSNAFVTSTALDIYDFIGQRMVTTTTFGDGALNMILSGNYLFIPTSSRIHVVDVRIPAQPIRYTLQSSNANDRFVSVAVEGTTLYALDATSNSLRIFDLGGVKTMGLDAENAWIGNLGISQQLTAQGQVVARGGLVAGSSGIHSEGGIVAQMGSASPTASFLNSDFGNRAASGTSWGVFTNSIAIGQDFFGEVPTGTANFNAIIKYGGASQWGGLCLDDYLGDTDTCPTNGVNGASILADGAITADAFDLAEVYAINGTSTPGDLVTIDASVTTTAAVKRSTGIPYDPTILGIVSTDPGFVLGWNEGAKVALTGRVPLKVAMTNGPIQIGDALTSSDVPGYAMKATKPGMVVGYALGELNATGTVETFVTIGYWAGDVLTTDGISSRIADDLIVGATSTANALNPTADSWSFTFRGSAWDASSTSAVNHDFVFSNNVLSATNSLLTIRNTTGTDIFTLNQEGDLTLTGDIKLAGRLYPSARGTLQDDYYIFVDDTSSTSQYLSTNADGWLTQNSYDLAERYFSVDALQPGELVMAGAGAVSVQRTTGADVIPLGIVSTKPGFLLGRMATDTYPIALAGRVPTKVTGDIQIGDEVGPSDIPGVATKSHGSNRVVGIALETHTGNDIGYIEVFVKSGGIASSVTINQTTAGPAPFDIQAYTRSGIALIESGLKRVRVTYDSIGGWPKVLATPQGEAEGGWWTENYSDTGFDIVMKQEQPRDVSFSWEVKPVILGERIFRSDGQSSIMNTTTGQPEGGWSDDEEETPSSTEPVVEPEAPTSTEPTPPSPEPEPTPEPPTEPEAPSSTEPTP